MSRNGSETLRQAQGRLWGTHSYGAVKDSRFLAAESRSE